jgi:hypothetical protein
MSRTAVRSLVAVVAVAGAVVIGVLDHRWKAGAPAVTAELAAAPSEVAGPAGTPPEPQPGRRRQVSPSASDGDGRAAVESLEEAQLMARLRQLAEHDSARAVALAREGNRRFPDSPDAPERTSILIHALAEEGEAMKARGEAEEMVNHYPDSDWVREIERFTGAHRHRNLRITDAGAMIYQ